MITSHLAWNPRLSPRTTQTAAFWRYLDRVEPDVDWGMPVGQIISAEGHPNHLLPILRELLSMIPPGRLFLLIYDDGLNSDHLLLDRVLTEFGAQVARLPLARVPVDGPIASSRYGGRHGVALREVLG